MAVESLQEKPYLSIKVGLFFLDEDDLSADASVSVPATQGNEDKTPV